MDATTGATSARISDRRLPLRIGDSPWARLRELAGYSQRELETASGVSRGIISLIEGERRLQPSPAEAWKLLAALRARGVSI